MPQQSDGMTSNGLRQPHTTTVSRFAARVTPV
jgi:hypothetical protein